VNASRGIPGKIWTDLSLLARRTFRHLPGQAEAGPRPSHVTESGRSILAVKSGYAAFSRLEENPPETISELRTSEANCAATYFRSWGGMPIKWRGTSRRPFPMVGGPLVRVPRPTIWLATATRRSRQRDSELCLCRARKRNSHQSNLRWLWSDDWQTARKVAGSGRKVARGVGLEGIWRRETWSIDWKS